MILLNSNVFFGPPAPTDKQLTNAVHRWQEQLSNMTYAANATQPTYPPLIRQRLDDLFTPPPPPVLPPRPPVYFRRLGVTFKGTLLGHTAIDSDQTLTDAALATTAASTANATSAQEAFVKMDLGTSETANKSVAAIKGNMYIRESDRITTLKLTGFHYRDNGTLYLYGAEARNITQLLQVVKMMPNNATFTQAQNLTSALYPTKRLERLVSRQAELFGIDQNGSSSNNQTASCDYEMYMQLRPVPKRIEPSALADLEEELQSPTGKSTIAMPPLEAHILMYSTECHALWESAPSTEPLVGLKVEVVQARAIRYAALVIVIGFIQVLLTIHQIDYTLTPSSLSKVSFWSVCIQTIMDAYLCIFHLSSAMATETYFLPFMAAGFFTFTLASICEIRYLLAIWKVQQAESGGGPMLNEGQLAGPLYFRFCVMFLAGLLLFYAVADGVSIGQRVVLRAFFGVLFSFWWPQIYRNVSRGSSRGLNSRYIWGMSLTRLFFPLYAFALPDSVLADQMRPEVWYLVGYVGLQIAILLVQDQWGARFFVPARYLPPTYNYHPALPPMDQESAAGEMESRTCAICLVPIETASAAPSQILSRANYMVTPCHHLYHTKCLQRWMQTKLECPVCRSALPPI
ncbi:hypothetical protein H4R34_000998 [Dimargaris verticillata]|uniref:RING-type E3 ubiquitin transferase n=1 Tax=Dimargaris verticillata TaxID=2761393 RepID=A0A9W8BC98_9FUNG|nr:hypothetical protein H4R34_000998 [Dimargaris verticillata]